MQILNQYQFWYFDINKIQQSGWLEMAVNSFTSLRYISRVVTLRKCFQGFSWHFENSKWPPTSRMCWALISLSCLICSCLLTFSCCFITLLCSFCFRRSAAKTQHRDTQSKAWKGNSTTESWSALRCTTRTQYLLI